MSNTGRIIVLRGPPGVGKTSVGLVVRERCAPAVLLNVDQLRSFAWPRDTTSALLGVAKRAAFAAAREYAAEGFVAIIDSVFADTAVLDAQVTEARRLGLGVECFTLSVSADVACERNGGREPFFRVEGSRAAALYQAFAWDYGVVVRTNDMAIEDVAEFITDAMGREEHRR